MKVWSKGLGNIELILDFEKYRVETENVDGKENVYIKGVITDPVFWDFRITMDKSDIPGLLHVAINRLMIMMFVKNLKMTIVSAFRSLLPSKTAPAEAEQKAA
ncbi:MAG: hypothetical protein ABIH66_01610 [bacterium]